MIELYARYDSVILQVGYNNRANEGERRIAVKTSSSEAKKVLLTVVIWCSIATHRSRRRRKDLSGGRGRLSHSKPIKEEFYLLENLAEKS